MKEMDTTSHNTEEQAPKMAAEPTAVYRTAAGGESLLTLGNITVSRIVSGLHISYPCVFFENCAERRFASTIRDPPVRYMDIKVSTISE